MARLTARRVRRLRARIAANRCAVRPGITHRWTEEAGFDPTSFGSVMEWWQCSKCWAVER